MQKGRQLPAWLARRTYFKRIERWAASGKARKGGAGEVEAVALPDNVVPFPRRAGDTGAAARAVPRGVGLACTGSP